MKFVTIFPSASDTHLNKDVFMLPKNLAKLGYESVLVCSKKPNQNLIQKDKDVRVEFLSGETGDYESKAEYSAMREYINAHAKDIDILNLYHINFGNLKLVKLYKRLNPSGISYIKSDLDLREFKNKPNFLKESIRKKYMRCVDIVSSESKDLCFRLSQRFNRKVEYIPNGYAEVKLPKEILNAKKQNVFLSVGRLGTEQKRTEDLVNAYLIIYKKCDFDLWLVGTETDEFKEFMSVIYSDYPDVKKRIKEFGEIKYQKKLFEIYAKSKMLVLPSGWESF